MRLTTLRAAAVLGTVLLLAACNMGKTTEGGRGTSSTRRTSGVAQKSGSGQLRTDLEPLVKRFSALGEPLSAKWMSGTMGDPRVPGPSTYWIDAVVEVTPARARELRRDHGPEVTQARPDVVAGLQPSLPAGPLLASDALDRAFTEGGYGAKAYLAADSDVVILVALGS